MSHNCFISFKKEDSHYRDEIANKLDRKDIVGKSLDTWIDSDDIDYTEYHEELEKYYNDGLIYKISYRINNQPGHIYCLGSKVICENEIDTSSIEPIINKVRQRYLNPANEPL